MDEIFSFLVFFKWLKIILNYIDYHAVIFKSKFNLSFKTINLNQVSEVVLQNFTEMISKFHSYFEVNILTH